MKEFDTLPLSPQRVGSHLGSNKDRFQISKCPHIVQDRILFTVSVFLSPALLRVSFSSLTGNEAVTVLWLCPGRVGGQNFGGHDCGGILVLFLSL